MADPNEIRDDFYAVMPQAKAINEDHYKVMQTARTSWAAAQ